MSSFRCILVDRPGCGLSPRLGRPLIDMDDLGSFAEDLVVDLLDAIDAPRAHLIGTSLGGYVVLRAAGAHPERVDRLVTLSWSLGAPTGSTPLYMGLAM